jgi:Fe-S-cluster containining protein
VTEEYRALVEKVSTFCEAVATRCAGSLACGPGCSSCCEAWLTVCAVERAQLQRALAALPAEERTAIARRGEAELTRERSGASPARCALLQDDGRCAVYEHRPLVCRTQGLALRYPNGVVPAAAVRLRVSSGEVTHCPLNYRAGAPDAKDVLDAERVDQLLALVNLRYAQAHGEDPAARYAISDIARGLEG